jgi:hypothetical protein
MVLEDHVLAALPMVLRSVAHASEIPFKPLIPAVAPVQQQSANIISEDQWVACIGDVLLSWCQGASF